jgi:hypothetical protein
VVTDDGAYSAFEFFNETLKEFSDKRLPQKILIDVGGPEETPLGKVSELQRVI